jgi:hypothetical protein
MSRSGLLLLLLLAAVVALLLWWRRTPTEHHEPATPAPTAASPTEGMAAAASPTPPRFRLAGVAVGSSGSYAVLEDPHGVTALYRLGDEIIGLGRLSRIEEQEVVIDTESEPMVLRLRPAPTPTAWITTPDVVEQEEEPASPPHPSAGDSDPESSP